ncbi:MULTISPECIES: DUF2934 domain-containing protein [Marinovum]|jgi:hypothetical protein|uniref:DUF2934 domain-containing protein n=1 Tax=Marinovum TaxID=367771 RepID=UPI00237BB698|nr:MULTISPECIES: DUF2934 domain-containing protein [Marinovum]MDD9738641.1 DUF2934 domain-containing protein [Marinovum sp. SP66]MDD9744469.1 DUF2934 domain-containing protein [Marinovum sp. PR37]
MSEGHTADTTAIAEAAFYLWLEEGQPQGRDQEFWLRAEQTLNAAIAAPKARRATARKAASPKKAAGKTTAKAKSAAKPAAKAAAKTAPKTAKPKAPAKPKV